MKRKLNEKLQLNKRTVAELNQSEQSGIYGGLPLTVTCDNNKTCPAATGNCEFTATVLEPQPTQGTECARSIIGENNCYGYYTFDNKVKSCQFDCNTSLC